MQTAMKAIYDEASLLRIAKRYNNAKRSYLLVNPLQAKHLPTPPSAALDMMGALGKAVKERYPAVDLVIGFAETATAIGCMAAYELGAPYIQTTRESLEGEWLDFREEHSHAPEQKLYIPYLQEHLADARTVVLVDDELSTGKTVRNMVGRLQKEYGTQTRYVTASILYRLGEQDEAAMRQMNMDSVYLLRPSEKDYEAETAPLAVQPPKKAEPWPPGQETIFETGIPSLNPRLGVDATEYVAQWKAYAKRTADGLINWDVAKDYPLQLLVLGTEECMLPALLFGRELELRGQGVFCQATTRSPIGVSETQGYPISHGWQIESFYEQGRVNYIYNNGTNYNCDAVVVVSDAGQWNSTACQALEGALVDRKVWGEAAWIAWIGGEDHVRNL